jgi:hypothetical protein
MPTIYANLGTAMRAARAVAASVVVRDRHPTTSDLDVAVFAMAIGKSLSVMAFMAVPRGMW